MQVCVRSFMDTCISALMKNFGIITFGFTHNAFEELAPKMEYVTESATTFKKDEKVLKLSIFQGKYKCCQQCPSRSRP